MLNPPFVYFTEKDEKSTCEENSHYDEKVLHTPTENYKNNKVKGEVPFKGELSSFEAVRKPSTKIKRNQYEQTKKGGWVQ